MPLNPAALSSPPPAAFQPAAFCRGRFFAGAPSMPGQRFLLIPAFPAVACLPAALRLRLAVLGTSGGAFADSFRVLLVRLCRGCSLAFFRVGEDRLINVNCIVNKYFFLLIYKIKKIPPKRGVAKTIP